MSIDVLSVSSKGQVVLPISMRRQLSIGEGSKLAALVSGDTILLKVIEMPTISEFEKSLDEARDRAESVGYKEDDVADIVKEFRRNKHA